MDPQKELKDIKSVLESTAVSLQLIANKSQNRATACVSKRVICQRLSVPTVALDKLIHQGLASGGDYGIIEGKHFCRLDPNERNSSKFLYDPYAILNSAWENFKNV